MKIMGVDPGIEGAFAILGPSIEFFKMPLMGKNEMDYQAIVRLLAGIRPDHVYLERAMPMAMGAKHAFNYGRGFAALEIAILTTGLPVTYVEPSKWPKTICEGIDSRLKPKERSLIAIQRLFPREVDSGITKNRNGKLHTGMIDALLIAEWGRRMHGVSVYDF